MRICEPSYYASFRCIAADCPDSCCREWEVLVDPDSAARYRAEPGELGDRLRRTLRTDDHGETWFELERGRCPMWRDDGLCKIQAELGEAALCATCTQFPRLRHDYGDFAELGLELSCPEAARLILTAGDSLPVSREIPGGEVPGYDCRAMGLLLESRRHALDLVGDCAFSVGQVLQRLMIYGYRVDGALNFPEDPLPVGDPQTDPVPTFPYAPGSMEGLFAQFGTLEILTADWSKLLAEGPSNRPWDDGFRPLIRYFVARYWLQAVSDLDLASRVKWIAVSCLMIRHLPAAFSRAAQLYSKEIENSSDNMDTLLDACFVAPAFCDGAILRLLEE